MYGRYQSGNCDRLISSSLGRTVLLTELKVVFMQSCFSKHGGSLGALRHLYKRQNGLFGRYLGEQRCFFQQPKLSLCGIAAG
jgi:hypothetical protein